MLRIFVYVSQQLYALQITLCYNTHWVGIPLYLLLVYSCGYFLVILDTRLQVTVTRRLAKRWDYTLK